MEETTTPDGDTVLIEIKHLLEEFADPICVMSTSAGIIDEDPAVSEKSKRLHILMIRACLEFYERSRNLIKKINLYLMNKKATEK